MPTPPPAPLLAPHHLYGRRTPSVLDKVRAAPVERLACYGYGKGALRDGLAALEAPAGGRVLLPALVPDGVLEAVRDADLSPALYPVTDRLTPDRSGLVARLDDDTAALVAVNYFGLPQPAFEDVRALAADVDAAVVDDNAHAPLSRDDTTLLGTRGHLGITSLHKCFPVPNGAVLYLDAPGTTDSTRTPNAKIAATPTAADARFLAVSGGVSARYRSRVVRWFVDHLRDESTGPGTGRPTGTDAPPAVPDPGSPAAPDQREDAGRDPARIYRAARVPMSWLTPRLLAATAPDPVIEHRRAAYRTWVDALADAPGLEPVAPTLAPGVCPQACPVLAADPAAAAALTTGLPGVATWPPLPDQVHTDPAFETARSLAARLVPLPCHPPVEAAAVDATIERYRRTRR